MVELQHDSSLDHDPNNAALPEVTVAQTPSPRKKTKRVLVENDTIVSRSPNSVDQQSWWSSKFKTLKNIAFPGNNAYRLINLRDSDDPDDREQVDFDVENGVVQMRSLPSVSKMKTLEVISGDGHLSDATTVECDDVSTDKNESSDSEEPETIQSEGGTKNMFRSGKKSWKEIILAWLSVGLALIAGASVGPIFRYMQNHGIRPCLSASWRCQCMTLILLPLAIIEVYMDVKKNKVDWFDTKPDLPYPLIVHVIFSGMAWSVNLLSWIIGLQYTTIFLASVLACSHPILLAVCMRIIGVEITWMEVGGVVISFSGMVLSCLHDIVYKSEEISSSSSSSATASLFLSPAYNNYSSRSAFSSFSFDSFSLSSSSYSSFHSSLLVSNSSTFPTPPSSDPQLSISLGYQLFGYLLCLLAAFGEVVVLFNRIKTKKYVPLMQYTCATTVIVALNATIISLLLERKGIIFTPSVHDGAEAVEIFCFDEHCVFGWMSSKWIMKILTFGLWIGVFCVAGFNYAVRTFLPSSYLLKCFSLCSLVFLFSVFS
jgi:hypothetical protein